MPPADPFPAIIEARPRSDAMDVGHVAKAGLGHEGLPIPGDRRLDQPIDHQLPARGGDLGLHAEIEHRPVLDLALSGRQTLLRRPRLGPRQQPTRLRPALLALDELRSHAIERRVFVVIIHSGPVHPKKLPTDSLSRQSARNLGHGDGISKPRPGGAANRRTFAATWARALRTLRRTSLRGRAAL